MSGNSRVVWVDVENPTSEDLAVIKDRFGLHEVIVKELEAPSVRAHAEFYEDYVFFVYNFPTYNPAEQTSRRTEIDFVITRDAVVTVRYEPIESISALHGVEASTPFELLYAIFQGLLRFEERQLRHVRGKLEGIGDELFKHKENEILHKVSFLKRDVSEYRIIVRSGESILKSLSERGPGRWGEESRVYLNDLVGDHFKIVSQIEDYRETLADFERTNSQLMYSKTTDVMKTLTAFSFLTFPSMLFVALFSMNIPGNPITHYPNAFWTIAGAIVLGITSLVTYFKLKDWL